MAHRSYQHLESVSCSCGHGYCVFCIKAYLEQQKFRASLPEGEVEWLIEAQFQPGDVRDSPEGKPETTGVVELGLDTVGIKKSRPASQRRRSSQVRSSQAEEEVEVESIAPDFGTREEFIQYAQEITLDEDTAFKNLVLSEGNKRVTNVGRSQRYLDCPDRFNFFWQVLSADSLGAGRSYVELEWSGPWIYVAAAYQIMQRYGDGKECGFGGNDKSWALHCRRSGYNFWHDAKSVAAGPGPTESRIGLYLDHAAGVLTFYSVRDETMTRLHRVRATFTQPLHVGLWLAVDASAVFCKLK